MITSLHIKNIALIKELKLELTTGLNILSGETGAGKSIIIDSLNFVLGDKADKSLIRYGESTASVQVIFSTDNLSDELKNTLNETGIELDDFLIIRRTMNENSKNECRINDMAVTLTALKRIVSQLVDIHSQHEHQSLLSESNHIKILDNYSKNTRELKVILKQRLSIYRKAENELSTFPSEDERARQMDILSFQINEITDAKIYEGEEEKLIQERLRINNSQKIIDALSSASNKLNNDDGYSALTSIGYSIKELNSIAKYNEIYADLLQRLDVVKIELNDIASTISDEIDDASNEVFDSTQVEKRLDVIRSIKKRFGYTLDDIMIFLDKAQNEYDRLNFAEERISKLESIIKNESIEIIKLSKELHDKRVEISINFEKEIMSNLNDLGMTGSVFKVDIVYPDNNQMLLNKVGENGVDEIKFLISPNKGEPLRPLAKIASGGEMSRFMLGLKNITAELEGIDTLVFDEIDTGISGHIAKVVANKLFNIAVKRQVLAVTHLPQLAAMADTHYLISKEERDGKTYTYVNPLNPNASLKEIMRLTGADINSKSGLENAKELKATCDEYKKSKSIASNI
ncbi:MAG: DNA repair protein RecN [Christensenellaceae bacterium]|jgi:DNA repair protein RecN (Recombination protein N)|nr:DNA repair protein RecN [Christensenellaceae bacterium]